MSDIFSASNFFYIDYIVHYHITDTAVYSSMVKRYTSLLNALVSADMDFTQLEAFLSSQMRKKQVSFNSCSECLCLSRIGWKICS